MDCPAVKASQNGSTLHDNSRLTRSFFFIQQKDDNSGYTDSDVSSLDHTNDNLISCEIPTRQDGVLVLFEDDIEIGGAAADGS